MCGIVGFVNAEGSKLTKAALLFEELLLVDTLRGVDGTGVALVPSARFDDDTVYTYKRAMWAPEFVCANGYKKGIQPALHDARLAIGHNRAASKSQSSDRNSHPFQNKHITLVHNGYISNAYQITPKGFGPEVDSEAAAWAIAEHGEKEGLEKLRGPFALAWYNKTDSTFNLARNEGREMHCIYIKHLNTMFYASEWMMLHLVLKRNDMLLDGKYRLLAPFQHFKFPIDNPREFTRQPFQEPQTQTGGYTNKDWGRTTDTNTESLGTSQTKVTQDTQTGSSATGSTSSESRRSLRAGGATIDTSDLERLETQFKRLHKDNKKGGCIPTSRGKIRAVYTKLAQINYRLGMTLMVNVDSFQLYKNQRTHGSVMATRRHVTNMDKVVMPNISAVEFENLRKCRMVYVTLVNLKVDKKTGVRHLVGVLDTWQNSAGQVRPRNILAIAKTGNTVVDTETGEEIKMVHGPGGVLIPLATFLEKTKTGCGECDKFVNPDKSEHVLWLGDSPICHECTSDVAIVHKLFPDKVEFDSSTSQYKFRKVH